MTTTSSDLPYFPASAPAVFSGPPEPILALVTPVLDAIADLVDRPGADDLRRPTPCTQWDVERLRDHVLGWLQFFAAALEDPERTRPRLDPDAYRLATDERTAGEVVRAAARTIEQAVRDGVQQRRVVVSQSVMDGSALLAMMLGEYLTHGWDLRTGPRAGVDPLVRGVLGGAGLLRGHRSAGVPRRRGGHVRGRGRGARGRRGPGPHAGVRRPRTPGGPFPA